MTGQRTGAFVETPVDTSKPAKAPDAPVSAKDIIGANWTLSGQDLPGSDLQDEIDAYAPVVNALGEKAPRDWFGNQKNYFGAYRSSHPYNYGAIWEDITKYRAADPNFLKDVPAKTAEEFTAWVKTNRQKARVQAQDVVRREDGLGQKALGFGTGVVSSFRDPINLGGMLLTGGTAGGARSILSTMARDAVTNMAIETAELPTLASNRAQFGEGMSATDMIEDVAMAGAAGAAFPVAGKLGKTVAKPVAALAGDTLAPAVRATERALAPWAAGRMDVAKATDAEIASSFAKSVPFEARTPEAQAGLYVLERETEVHGASPFLKTPGGLDANAEKLTATTEMLSKPASVGRAAAPARAQPRATTPLTQDRVINFVLTDLEGGGKLVNLGDGGGLTKYGVTERSNPDVDVANLSQADATRIARQRYWLPEFNRADPRVAAIAFDANYISSPRLARRIIAEAGDDAEKALSIYREHLNHLADSNPEKARFKKGWNNRLDKLARFVGENEAGSVKLDPSAFEGDDIAYRAQMEDLNREELRLADDTPGRADPVRDFVDRQAAGEDLTSPEAQRFAVDNADAINVETARRAEVGTDGHPDPLAGRSPSAVDDGQPSRAQTTLATREMVRRSVEEVTPQAVADALGVSLPEARAALKRLVDEPTTFRTAKGSTYRVEADGTTTRDKAFRPEHGFAEQGPQPRSERTYYVSPEDAQRLGEFQAQGGPKVAIQEMRDGTIGVRYLEGKDKGKFEKRTVVTPQRKPSPGLMPVETWKKGSRVHFGNEIVDVADNGFTEPPPAPPSLDPKTYGVDSPTDAEAKLLADSAVHDVRALADAGNATKFEIVEGATPISAKELVESLDRDQSAIDAIRACL